MGSDNIAVVQLHFPRKEKTKSTITRRQDSGYHLRL